MAKRVQKVCALEKDPIKALDYLEELKNIESWLSRQDPAFVEEITANEARFNIDHIFLVDNLKLKGGRLEFSGFHFNGNNFIEKSGLAKLTNKVELGAGTYTANLTLHGKSYKKTFFDPNKKMMDVMKDVYYALKKYKPESISPEKAPGSYSFFGQTKDNVFVKFVMDTKGCVRSAYVDSKLMEKKFGK